MEELNILNSLIIYGPLGIGCLALGTWVVALSKGHRKERIEWKDQSKDQFDKIVELVSASTTTVASLKSTLESIERSIIRRGE